ncbi:MAG: 3-phosphoshikimate 1-carboxyvinyltransferase [Clostridium sp.]|nr:3-phosphoshikimate 1-carboxyvinyltransferase [Clostridium sp.]
MADLRLGNAKLIGNVKVPPSKSMAHRAIICASLSKGISKIQNIDFSDDIIATIEAMKSLGANIYNKENYIEVHGINYNKIDENLKIIDCNESGSTLRFLVPISLLVAGKKKFIGRGNLGKRPLYTFYEIFKQDNIEYSFEKDILNLEVDGKLKGGEYYLAGNISSQFITGLLFTLPLIDRDSKIIITTEMESKGYIDLTLSALKDFGIEVINNNYKEFIIKGNQEYKARNYRVEGDYSQAAFFLTANAIGNKVEIDDILASSAQGDKEAIDILERMGMVVQWNESQRKIIAKENNTLKATIIDGSQCPDIIPVLSVVAALAKGTTKIIKSGRLRIKECDRLKAIASELTKLGAKIEEREDGLIIEGVESLKGGVEVWSWKDHRIAMTLAIVATVCKEPIILKDYECISKSYPSFFDDYRRLGGIANEWNVGE